MIAGPQVCGDEIHPTAPILSRLNFLSMRARPSRRTSCRPTMSDMCPTHVRQLPRFDRWSAPKSSRMMVLAEQPICRPGRFFKKNIRARPSSKMSYRPTCQTFVRQCPILIAAGTQVRGLGKYPPYSPDLTLVDTLFKEKGDIKG